MTSRNYVLCTSSSSSSAGNQCKTLGRSRWISLDGSENPRHAIPAHTPLFPTNVNTLNILYTTLRIKGALERVPLVLGLLERHTELKERDNGIPKVVEEDIVVIGIQLSVLPEALVLDNLQIRRQHHERLGPDVLELLGAVPLLVLPLLLKQQLEVVVGQGGGAECPGTREARAVRVAAAEGVGAGQSNHGAVVEAHASEDGADVARALAGVGQAAVGGTERDVAVGAACAVGDLGALHFLDGTDASEDPEIGVGDPRECFLDGCEEVAGSFEAGVGTVVTLGGETHGGTIRATGVGQLIIAVGCQYSS